MSSARQVPSHPVARQPTRTPGRRRSPPRGRPSGGSVKGGSRCLVVAATGSQSLDERLWLTEQAATAGADALLVVTPYYSQPPQRGLIRYMQWVASTVPHLPILLCHILGRAGVSVTVDTLLAMKDACDNPVGVKHASADVDFVSDLMARTSGEFTALVGLEHLTLPMLAAGASGMVNALANIAPRDIVALFEAVDHSDLNTARRLSAALHELNRAILWDTNPIALRYMMRWLGLLARNEHRLPMVPADPALEARPDAALERARRNPELMFGASSPRP
ncbi:MAG: 4-hydroxy-tetrahydrodipicolinate synthase [Pseudonocardiaceae bacterium]|nr:MAG: 4-hydroxy-tetrahydrodipicolinate synthase [Pseudonocardiaceae bacterium]